MSHYGPKVAPGRPTGRQRHTAEEVRILIRADSLQRGSCQVWLIGVDPERTQSPSLLFEFIANGGVTFHAAASPSRAPCPIICCQVIYLVTSRRPCASTPPTPPPPQGSVTTLPFSGSDPPDRSTTLGKQSYKCRRRGAPRRAANTVNNPPPPRCVGVRLNGEAAAAWTYWCIHLLVSSVDRLAGCSGSAPPTPPGPPSVQTDSWRRPSSARPPLCLDR